jgi:hypothetical protein
MHSAYLNLKPRPLFIISTFTLNMGVNNTFQRVWSKYLPLISLKLRQAIAKNDLQQINLDKFDFTHASASKSYSFSLEFKNGATLNNMKMSPIAREFAEALNSNEAVKQMVKSGHFTFKLSSNFVLSIQKHSAE